MSDFSIFIEDGNELLTFSPLGQVIYRSYYVGRPASLTIDLPANEASFIHVGSTVFLAFQGDILCKGYVFAIETVDDQMATIYAWDQIRFLKNKDSQIYRNQTATQVIENICNLYNLEKGNVANTGYQIPYRIIEEKTLLDIIYDALELTTINTGNEFIFFDKGGKLTLESKESLITDFWLDKESIHHITHEKTIESLYNSVTLIQQDNRSGFKALHQVADTKSQETFGRLSYYRRIPVKTDNPMKMANQILQQSNRVKEKITIQNAMGIPFLRGGHSLYIGENQDLMTITSVSHKITENHLMDLEVVFYGH